MSLFARQCYDIIRVYVYLYIPPTSQILSCSIGSNTTRMMASPLPFFSSKSGQADRENTSPDFFLLMQRRNGRHLRTQKELLALIKKAAREILLCVQSESLVIGNSPKIHIYTFYPWWIILLAAARLLRYSCGKLARPYYFILYNQKNPTFFFFQCRAQLKKLNWTKSFGDTNHLGRWQK